MTGDGVEIVDKEGVSLLKIQGKNGKLKRLIYEDGHYRNSYPSLEDDVERDCLFHALADYEHSAEEIRENVYRHMNNPKAWRNIYMNDLNEGG